MSLEVGRMPLPARSRAARWALTALGLGLAALAVVGAFLPVLPTTPFLLLAAARFARSSQTLHRRLLQNRVFGPYLGEWDRTRAVPRKAKRKAYGLVVVSFALSITMVGSVPVRVGHASGGRSF